MGNRDKTEWSDTQRRIIDSAIEAFASKGYDGASTAEIAKKANVAEGTIFKHFKTKRELLLAVMGPFILRFAAPLYLASVKKLLSDADTPIRDVLRRLFYDRINMIESHWSETKILAQEMLKFPELRESFVDNLATGARSVIENFLTKRMETGEIRNMDVFTASRSIAGTIVSYVIAKHAFAEEAKDWSDSDNIEEMLDFIMFGLSAKSSPESQSKCSQPGCR